jgi:hypothetical protein
LDEERTHRISVELEDGTGVIDLFVTITITTALQEATNDGDNSSQVALDVIPSRLTDEDIKRYVRHFEENFIFIIFRFCFFIEIFLDPSFI